MNSALLQLACPGADGCSWSCMCNEVRVCDCSARGQQQRVSERPAKNMSDPEEEMRPECDFTRGVRGKYAQAYSEGTNLVLLDEDVSHAFPDSESVNSALRLLIRLAREAQEHSAQ